MRTPAPQTPAFAVPETRMWRASGSCPGKGCGPPDSTSGCRAGPFGRSGPTGSAHRPTDRAPDAHPTRRNRAHAGHDRAATERRGARNRALRRTVRRGFGRLERAAEPAHPDGEVVLHDLPHLRLGQELVGAERVLDAGRRV